MRTSTVALFGVFLFSALASSVQADYEIGIGIADCTGPSVEITLMGYAKLGQIGCGIHLRQFSRAYIIDDGKTRAVFVTVDTSMMSHGLRMEVLKRLKAIYNDTYTEKNVIMSGTHTHGTPGGFLMDLMYDIPNLGFVVETFNALASGITQSIVNAHDNIVEGKIYLTSGELLDANINRSPASYLLNPEEERAKYDYNVDKDIVQLKFVRSSDNQPIGAINWFAVHATSMNNTNCLVTSDNVGYASIQFESFVNNGAHPGKGSFVGAFASTNLGDVSPNTKGPMCINTGEPCDFVTSTCDGEAKWCIASGPGDNMVESTEIIAGKLLDKAKELFAEENTLEVTGPVQSIHQWVDMPKERVTIELANGTTQEIRGCIPAMGYSFAGGTTDGPGEFNFAQGTLTENPFWDAVRDAVFPPTEDEIACQAPKPILINTGVVSFPYSWQPQIVSCQIIKIGDVALLAVPGEFTTMSGRRLRDAVKQTLIENGGSENSRAIITGLSNVYTSYIATPEEYQLQRYEGASTIFGPQTLNIYIHKYKELANALTKELELEDGPFPEDFSGSLITLVSPVQFDGTDPDTEFGDCIVQPPETVALGDTVSVKFVSGNPRNDVMHGSSFLSVDRLDGDDWVTVFTDAHWETRFSWKRINSALATSEVTIEWDVGPSVEPGTYRIVHTGHYKTLLNGDIVPYEGHTQNFSVK